jgi:quinolinate synthase
VLDQIATLKKRKNAVILSHFYEDGDIQDIADHVGDSLFLAQKGQASQADIVLLAGVVFMGESVKILSPNKKVLVPDLAAGCSLVNHAPADKFREWRRQYPDHICVTYINSSAEVKALSDVICTSSNAEKILNAIPKDRGVLFAPDRHLGGYLQKKLNRKMELWQGFCEVHVLFSAQKLAELKAQYPHAVVIAHPECDETVLAHAHVIGSTSRLLEEVQKNPAKQFIVATEDGIFHQMRKARPDAELIQAPAEGSCACNQCPYMKLNTLEKITKALETEMPEVNVPTYLMDRARVSLQRMMDITEGRPVSWPDRFDG